MKVLVAIDTKPSSQALIDAVLKMHWHVGTEIHLLSVLPPWVRDAGSAGPLSATVEELEDLAVDLKKCLNQCEVTFLTRHGDPAAEILELHSQLKADLIVLGSNCKNTVERLILGSVCQAVLNESGCPVIVAKAPCNLAREASPLFKNILIPVDNSIFSDVAVQWLANLNWSADTRFVIAAAVESDTDLEQVQKTLAKRAFELSKMLNTNNIVTDVATGEARQAILNLATQYYTDLIVMGSHGRKGIKKLILGSLSEAISQAAPCAVAIVSGIAGSDPGWMRTGAFAKVKMASYDYPGSRDGGRPDLSVNVMPGGF